MMRLHPTIERVLADAGYPYARQNTWPGPRPLLPAEVRSALSNAGITEYPKIALGRKTQPARKAAQ